MAKKNTCCTPFYADCEYEAVPNVLQMLETAMKNEKKSAKFYKYMAKMSQCDADKDLFMNLRRDEKRHFGLLQEIYRDLTCECYCMDYINAKYPNGFCSGVKKAICKEMDSVKLYEQLAHCLIDVQHKEVVCCIMNEEKEHAQALAALYKLAQDCAIKKSCCSVPSMMGCMTCGEISCKDKDE